MKVLSVPGTREEYRQFLAELPSPEERIWYREYYSEQHDKYGKYLGYVNDVLFGSSPANPGLHLLLQTGSVSGVRGSRIPAKFDKTQE